MLCSKLIQEKEIDEDAIFIDGTKLEANANKYTFVWKKDVKRFDAHLVERSNMLYEEPIKNEIIPAIERESAEVLSPDELAKIATELDSVVEQFSAEIETTDTGQKRKELCSKRKTPKKFRKLFQEFAERKAKYQKHFHILGERNS